MIRLNISEARAHLARYLGALSKGEVIILCKRNKPIAEIRGVSPRGGDPRPIGLCEGQFEVPPEFFDPLPEDIVDAFNGGQI